MISRFGAALAKFIFFVFFFMAISAHAQIDLKVLRDSADFPDQLLKAVEGAASLASATSLLTENLKFVRDIEKRRSLTLTLAALLEISGDFRKAAERYEEAAFLLKNGSDSSSLLSACADWIVIGEAERAEAMLKVILVTSRDIETLYRARLLSGWAAVISGRHDEACAIARELQATNSEPAAMLQSMMLLWVASDGLERDSWGLRIKELFGMSPEARLVENGVIPSLPHWLLSGLFDPDTEQAGLRGQTLTLGVKPDPVPTITVPASSGDTVVVSYQIGAFSTMGNAVILKTKLESGGFLVQIIAKKGSSGEIFTVVVVAGMDPGATLIRIKDAGFEAYPIYGKN